MAHELFMNTCRICLLENNIMIPIFGEDGIYRRVREMIKDTFNINLNLTDPLPRKICCKCFFKLQQAYQFKVDFQKSTRHFINCMTGQRTAESMRAVKTLQGYLGVLSGAINIRQGDVPPVVRQVNQVRGAPQGPQTIRPAPSTSSTSNGQPMRNVFRVVPSGRMKFKMRKPQVPCAVCGKLFLSKKSANAHMHKNHTTAEVNKICQKFKCSVCLRSFETLVGLNLHRHRNHRLPPFNSYSKGQQHSPAKLAQPVVPVSSPNPLEVQSPETTYECGLCFRICKSEGLLKMHMSTVHKEANPNPISSTTPSMSVQVVDEIINPTNNPPLPENLECSLCFQPFRNVNGLVNHLRTAHGKPSCSICLEIFATQEELNAHRQTHKPGYTEQQGEKQKVVPQQDVFTCNICGKSFDNSTSLSRHKGYHTKMGPNWQPSDLATTTSTVTPANFRQSTPRPPPVHSDSDDSPKTTFRCNICGKQFDGSLSLARHKACHAKLGPHWVPGAGRKTQLPQKQTQIEFNSDDYEPVDKKPLLNNEGTPVDKTAFNKLKSNATSIPFCLYCKKIFESQSNLWEHICQAHPTDPRYRCRDPGCMRVFFSGTGFRSHQTAQGHDAPPETANSNKSVECGPSMAFLGAATYTPTNNIPKCQICMRRFTNIQNLKRHIKQAHRSAVQLKINPSSIINTYGRKLSRVLCHYCPKYLSSKYIGEHEKMHRIRGDKQRAATNNATSASNENQEEIMTSGAPEEEDEEQEDAPINSSIEIKPLSVQLEPMNIPDSITITPTQVSRAVVGENSPSESPELFKAHRKTPRAPTCKYCGLTASSFYELKDHLEASHPGQIYHVCDGCPEIYFDRKTLVSHNIVHSRVYLNCKYCNKSFARPLALRGHENKCLYLQRRQQNLQQQANDEDGGASTTYSYNCEFCSEKFSDSITFVQHLQSHAN